MSQTEDIVRRMRELHQWFEADRWPQTRMHQASISLAANEAADEIERLRREVQKAAEVEELRKGILADEVAENLRLIEALEVAKEIEAGTACMDAMLGKIKSLREAVRALARNVYELGCTLAEFKHETGIEGWIADEVKNNPVARAAIEEAKGE